MPSTWFDGMTVTVEIAFGDSPSTASPTWTDVTDDVQNISTSTGRSSERDAFDAGVCTIQLLNQARRYDPEYTGAGAPYNGNIKPRKQVRVRATYSAVTYDLWRGVIDGWTQNYEVSNNVATVTVVATDATKLLSLMTISTNPYRTTLEAMTTPEFVSFRYGQGIAVSDPSGTAYVEFETSDQSTPVPNRVMATDITALASSQVTAPLIPGSEAALQIKKGQRFRFGHISGPTTPYSMGFAFRCDTLPQVFTDSANDFGSLLNYAIGSLGVTPQGFLQDSGSLGGLYARIAPGEIHSMAWTVNSGGTTLKLYIDGYLIPSPAVPPSPGQIDAGNILRTEADPTGALTSEWTIDGLFLVGQELTAVEVMDLHNKSVGLYAGDSTTTQVQRVLTDVGWPAGLTSVDTGGLATQSFDYFGGKAIDALRDLEVAEQGKLYIDKAGVVTFKSRNAGFTDSRSWTSNATYGENSPELPYSEVSLIYNDDTIINQAIVGLTGRAPSVLNDSTSQTTYGKRSKSLTDLNVQDSSVANSVGNLILQRYKDPYSRIPSFTLNPRHTPATMFPVALNMRIGDRITVMRRPLGVGSAITAVLSVEGFRYALDSAGVFTVTLYASRVEATHGFIVGDATWGVVGTNVVTI